MFCINCGSKLKIHQKTLGSGKRYFCTKCFKIGDMGHNFNTHTGKKCAPEKCFKEPKPAESGYVIKDVRHNLELVFN